MARKKYSEKRFEITRKVHVKCWTEDTRSGFRHLAELNKGYFVEATAKATYYNRTWEAYDYESVLKKLLETTIKSVPLSGYALRKFKQMVKDPQRTKDDLAPLKSVAMVAKLGDIFGHTKKEKNIWKKRMLKAGLQNKGLIMPDGFDDLPKEEQERRLNGAIAQIS